VGSQPGWGLTGGAQDDQFTSRHRTRLRPGRW
jgi:hypothetical protein